MIEWHGWWTVDSQLARGLMNLEITARRVMSNVKSLFLLLSAGWNHLKWPTRFRTFVLSSSTGRINIPRMSNVNMFCQRWKAKAEVERNPANLISSSRLHEWKGKMQMNTSALRSAVTSLSRSQWTTIRRKKKNCKMKFFSVCGEFSLESRKNEEESTKRSMLGRRWGGKKSLNHQLPSLGLRDFMPSPPKHSTNGALQSKIKSKLLENRENNRKSSGKRYPISQLVLSIIKGQMQDRAVSLLALSKNWKTTEKLANSETSWGFHGSQAKSLMGNMISPHTI